VHAIVFSESLNRKQADLILARNCSVVVLALTGAHFQMPLDQLQQSVRPGGKQLTLTHFSKGNTESAFCLYIIDPYLWLIF